MSDVGKLTIPLVGIFFGGKMPRLSVRVVLTLWQFWIAATAVSDLILVAGMVIYLLKASSLVVLDVGCTSLYVAYPSTDVYFVLTLSLGIYYLAFPNDRRSSKIVVAFVAVAEILQTLANSRDSIRMFGAGWGNPQILEDIGWAWFSVPILGSLIASVGQIFFAWRIYIIAKSAYVPILITLVSAFQLGAGIWTGRGIWQINLLTQAWLAATAVSDFLIVAGMVFYLLKARQLDFETKTKATVSRIIKITVETGVLCALSAVIVLCLFIAFDGNNYHLGVCIWLSKVYSSSILVILNSRAHIGHGATLQSGTSGMIQMEVMFRSSRGLPSAMQGSMQSIRTMGYDDSNVAILESMGEVVERQFKMAV
ncbi:hypothetical protein MSAN_01725700 [Mycena sanguinolenta]|uniref:DUF6534 domain-containing protein n=1 Tax=Mycena sanguinolenta TaxID=230812 RepID=A0A8H7CT34_9AGAR|nr:hypothetical protein MSAN_01725700 [Mycena sanguinolenta]